METYDEYEFLEKHIRLSKELYLLDLEGKHILDEFEKNKVIRTKRCGNKVYCADVTFVYDELRNITNTQRFSLRLYFCLLHYLDELLFLQVKNIDRFFIEDEPYKLTDLYFNQASWNENEQVHEYKFYSENKNINTEEAMYLNMYLGKYIDYVHLLESFVNGCKNTGSTSKKLIDVLNRLTYKINGLQCKLLKLIKTDFEKN
jgi:hypothetical protein